MWTVTVGVSFLQQHLDRWPALPGRCSKLREETSEMSLGLTSLAPTLKEQAYKHTIIHASDKHVISLLQYLYQIHLLFVNDIDVHWAPPYSLLKHQDEGLSVFSFQTMRCSQKVLGKNTPIPRTSHSDPAASRPCATLYWLWHFQRTNNGKITLSRKQKKRLKYLEIVVFAPGTWHAPSNPVDGELLAHGALSFGMQRSNISTGHWLRRG